MIEWDYEQQWLKTGEIRILMTTTNKCTKPKVHEESVNQRSPSRRKAGEATQSLITPVVDADTPAVQAKLKLSFQIVQSGCCSLLAFDLGR